MTKIKRNFTLNQQDLDDIQAKAIEIGTPGPRGNSPGLRAIIAEWRRWKAEREARLDYSGQAAWEEYLIALGRHEEAEER